MIPSSWALITISSIAWSLSLYTVVLLICSYYYHSYLKEEIRFPLLYAAVLIYAGLFFCIAAQLFRAAANIINPLFLYSLLTVPIVVLALRIARKYKCKSEEVRELDGIEYVVCETDVINAWYDGNVKKIKVSSKFHNLLAKDELKAILLHEQGHERNRWIERVNSLVSDVWYLATSAVVILLLLLPQGEWSLAIVGLVIPFVLSVTVLAMTWSWIREHESDLNTLREVGYKAAAMALIKVHTYGAIEKENCLKYVKNIDFDEKTVLNFYNTLSLRKVLITLLKYSVNAPLWYTELLRQPIYPTHPPLEYRLAKLASNVSRENE